MRNKFPVLAQAVLLEALAAFLARRAPPPPTRDQQASDQRPTDQRPLAWVADDSPLAAHPFLATYLREGPRGLPWVIEYARPLVPADRASVAATGARILGFIPPCALLLEAPPTSRAALAALPGVADSSPLPPYRKIAPDLASAALSSPSAPVTVAVATTSPDDAPALSAALASAVSARLSSNSRRVLAAAPIRSDSWGTPSRAARNADS